MVFDVASGIYWRPEEGGMLWGMSNPDEKSGEAAEFDWGYYDRVRTRMAELVPVTADLLPILGPATTAEGPLEGTVVAAAGGHGMMWGPGVSRAAADLALHGRT